jgi:hypothetical protein
MTYRQLQIDPLTPQRVRGLIHHIDLSFSDVHAMLRLPIANYRITAGCNFAITHVLMSVIGGASTTLYKQTGQVGARFVGLLEDYYPWSLEPPGMPAKGDAAKTIYEVFRNPLTHDLGIDVKGKSKGFVVKTKRLKTFTSSGRDRGLTERKIAALETNGNRPNMSPTLTTTNNKSVLLVEGLYWGVRRMIESITHDHTRMAAADSFIAKL